MKPTALIATLILILSIVITAIMAEHEMSTLKYAFSGSLPMSTYLPLAFGVIISGFIVVVEVAKKIRR